MTPPAAPRVRAYAALELSSAWRAHLGEIAARLQSDLSRGAVRWAKPDGIHLTLKFYGEVKSERLPAIEDSLRSAADNCPPLRLMLEGLGVFPGLNRPRVIWAGVGGDFDALSALQKAVEDGAAALGFAREARPFAAHLTLGRVSEQPAAADLRKLPDLLGRPLGPAAPLTVTSLSLMRSELKPGGAVYTRLFAAPLNGRKF